MFQLVIGDERVAELMKLIPLVSALLLSVASVEAAESYPLKKSEEWLFSACAKSEENKTLCSVLKYYYLAYHQIRLLCDLRTEGDITQDILETKAAAMVDAARRVSSQFELEMFELGYQDAIQTAGGCSESL